MFACTGVVAAAASSRIPDTMATEFENYLDIFLTIAERKDDILNPWSGSTTMYAASGNCEKDALPFRSRFKSGMPLHNLFYPPYKEPSRQDGSFFVSSGIQAQILLLQKKDAQHIAIKLNFTRKRNCS